MRGKEGEQASNPQKLGGMCDTRAVVSIYVFQG